MVKTNAGGISGNDNNNDYAIQIMLGSTLSVNKETAFKEYSNMRYKNYNCKYLLSKLSNYCLQQITNNICNALIKKLPFNDNLLLLSFQYCQQLSLQSEIKFLQILSQSISNALTNSNTKKSYDYLWFKKFMLNSSIWYQPLRNEKKIRVSTYSYDQSTIEDNNNNKGPKLVFDAIYDIIQKELIIHQNRLKEEIDLVRATEPDAFEKVVKFSMNSIKTTDNDKFNDNNNNNSTDQIINLRQDMLECNYAEYNELEVRSGNDINYESHKEYEKVYLTKLLITAHQLNNEFQNSVSNLVKQFINNVLNKSDTVYFKGAKVKSLSRSFIKAQTDYKNEEWPKTAKILDLNRCSIIFDTCTQLIRGLHFFTNCVALGKAGCITRICRIKNGWKDIKNWKNVKDYGYRDIKFNVVIDAYGNNMDKDDRNVKYDRLYRNVNGSNNNTTNDNGNQIIGEIQFILDSFANIKDAGHSVYEIRRRKDLVNDIRTLLMNEENNNISNKMKRIIKHRDMEEFENELILDYDGKYVKSNELINFENNESLLYYLSQNKWINAANLYYGTILHWNQILSIEKDNNNNINLIKKYFENINDKNIINITDNNNNILLYGISFNLIEKYDKYRSFIKSLLKLNEIPIITNELLIYYCVCNNLYHTAQILIEQRSNDIGLKLGINVCNSNYTNNFSPLIKVLTIEDDNNNNNNDKGNIIRWLKLLTSVKNLDIKVRCQNKESKYFGQTAISIAQSKHVEKWLKLE